MPETQTETSGTNLGGSFMGWNFNVKGTNSIMVIVLLVLVGLILYGAYTVATNVTDALDHRGVSEITNAISRQTEVQAVQHDRIERNMLEHSSAAHDEHKAVRDAIEGLDRTMQEQNFIILMDAADRKNIRLKMPPSLREKLITTPSKH